MRELEKQPAAPQKHEEAILSPKSKPKICYQNGRASGQVIRKPVFLRPFPFEASPLRASSIQHVWDQLTAAKIGHTLTSFT